MIGSKCFRGNTVIMNKIELTVMHALIKHRINLSNEPHRDKNNFTYMKTTKAQTSLYI